MEQEGPAVVDAVHMWANRVKGKEVESQGKKGWWGYQQSRQELACPHGLCAVMDRVNRRHHVRWLEIADGRAAGRGGMGDQLVMLLLRRLGLQYSAVMVLTHRV